MAVDLSKYEELKEHTFFDRLGKVVKIVGLTVESVGPDAKLNDLCRIYINLYDRRRKEKEQHDR